MAAYLITYDLHDETYETELLNYVRAGQSKQVALSSYVVIRTESPSDIVTAIRKITKSETTNKEGKYNVTVCVVTVRKPWNGFVLPDVTEWMEKNLPAA